MHGTTFLERPAELRADSPLPAATAATTAPDAALAPAAPSIPTDSSVTTPARKSRGERAHIIISRLLLGGITLQIFFAGLGIFTTVGFLPHAILGSLVIGGSLALPIIAWRGHLDRSIRRISWELVGLMILQGLLIDAGRLVPAISALHPVNAMLLVLVTYHLARRRLS